MSSIKRRPNGKWRARYRDDDGKEHARHFNLERDAKKWLKDVGASQVRGDYVDPNAGKITFDEWVEKWSSVQVWELTTLEQANVAYGSVPFGGKQLKKITTADVQAWVKSMTKARPDRPGGLAASTITTRHKFVGMAFKAAVRDGLIAKNPAEGIPLPRQRRKAATMVIPTPDDIGKLLTASDDYFGTFVAVCAFAGLRLGEASGLQVTDIDFLGRTINVRRQVQGSGRSSVMVKAPKDQSERTIYAPTELMTVIGQHLEQFGAWVDDSGAQWVFTNGGTPFVRATAGARFRRARESAELSDFTLHDMRHFYASGLIASGCDVVTVQRALGHSSPSVTLDVYSHLWPSAEDKTRQASSGIMESVHGNLADYLRTEAATSL